MSPWAETFSVRALRRVFLRTDGVARLAALDGARALAALFVVFYHTWLNRCGTYDHACDPTKTHEPLSVSAVGLLLGHGDLGVDIFFVLSGYLIFAMLYPRMAPDLGGAARTIKQFLLRRFLRIYPALAVMIPLCMALFWIVPGRAGGAGALLSGCRVHGWSTYALLNNFPRIGGAILDNGTGNLGCTPWTWSVAVEWQFYLMSPLLVLSYVYVRRAAQRAQRPIHWWTGTGLGALLLLGSVGLQLFDVVALGLQAPGLRPEEFDAYMAWLYTNPLARCTPYLAGMAAAAYRHHTLLAIEEIGTEGTASSVPPSHGLQAWGVRAALAVILAVCGVGVLPFYPWAGFNLFLAGVGRTLFGACVGLVLIAGAAPGPSSYRAVRFLRHRIWYPVAQLSYSAYLWQFAGIEVARWIYHSMGVVTYESFIAWAGFSLLSVLLTFGLALPSYLFVEQPALRLRPAA